MRAMIIDDSRAMRMILTRTLSELGFEVTQAEHGQDALDQLAACEELPDVCLVDWNMPVLDGLAFITAVRRNRDWRQITLMMVTTESEHAQIVRALAAGAHEYLIKPFTPEAVEDKLGMLGLLAST